MIVKEIIKSAGFAGRGKTITRRINDVVQLVNFQPSNFSDDEYVNVAIWPLALGEPRSLVEHKFPIRGRIDDFIVGDLRNREDKEESLVGVLDNVLCSLDSLKEARRSGLLNGIYLSSDARHLLDN